MKQKLVEKATNIYNEAKNRRIYKPKIKLLEMTGDLEIKQNMFLSILTSSVIKPFE